MIPAIIAEEIRDTLLDYLDTTFNFQDEAVGKALKDFLTDPVTGIFKGPYIQIKLPFRKAGVGNEIPLDIVPGFTPYAHQLKSFARLTSKSEHKPLPTLVTTGTGSGKTECFLYPILDHCYRNIGKLGIKAIILYPMNALAADQARRLAGEIYNRDELRGKITAGMYVGGKGTNSVMGENNIIDAREELRKHPPDILLTNYKMLDYLLIRPEDRELWKDNRPSILKYLVLDELHTYDGAQGSDVACLIRRLKSRLEMSRNSLCPVGTSATVASEDGDAASELISFASQIFDEDFSLDSVIVEDRLDFMEFFEEKAQDGATLDQLPAAGALLVPGSGEAPDDYIHRQAAIWFGDDQLDANQIAAKLIKHSFLKTIMINLQNKVTHISELLNKMVRWQPDFGDHPGRRRQEVLQSFLTLVSYARVKEGGRTIPFLTCQFQLWVREMSRLMRAVSEKPEFFWRDSVPLKDAKKGLPAYYCRECGHTGWLSFMREQDERLEDDPSIIYTSYFEHGKNVRYVYPAGPEEEKMELKPLWDYSRRLLSTESLCLYSPNREMKNVIPVVCTVTLSKEKVPRDLGRCPACETDGAITIVGSQAASLSSVAISHLFTSPYNADKKMLAFTDSVQDASHRAGFFSARTYRFNFRTAIQAVLNSLTGNIPLKDFTKVFFDYWQKNRSTQELVATFMPPDLRQVGIYRKFIKGKVQHIPADLEEILIKRVSWEIYMEYGFNARVGRTLDKVGCSTAYIDPGSIDRVADKLYLIFNEELDLTGGLTVEEVRHFIMGFLTRTKNRGGVDHPLLRKFREEMGTWYFLTKEKNPWMSPFSSRGRLPRFLSLRPREKVFDSLVSSSGYLTWPLDWAIRSLRAGHMGRMVSQVRDIYHLAVGVLVQEGILNQVDKGNVASYGLAPNVLLVTRDTFPVQCSHCGHELTVGVAESGYWLGAPCLNFRCPGRYAKDDEETGSYYRKIYNSGNVKRIFAHEHTGLLQRDVRERVESLFKFNEEADAPNILTCTPTLEMGVDLGDLSATMACSIPPTTANYLQRIGRAGRATGNAFILALANVKPHDLYFFEEPLNMLSGSITPPGCFLNAPEMLRRHFLAFSMDSWVREDTSGDRIPKDVSMMLSRYKRNGFPMNFISYYEQNRGQLMDKFMALFEEQLTDDNKERVRDFAAGDELKNDIIAMLERVEGERKRLSDLRERVRKWKNNIEENKEKQDNWEEQSKEADHEMKVLKRLILNITQKYPLNLFTDEGLLPNYAFPETGVKLKTIIYGVDNSDEGEGNFNTETHEWIRPAGTAIREFAPFNTFYAENRRVRVDQVETGGSKNQSKIDEWQFCDECSHTELVSANAYRKTCPVCGSAGWSDLGQRHNMLKMAQVSAREWHLTSLTADESDEREMESYLLMDFFDVRQENWGGGFVNPDLPFGFEYLKQVTLREVNFGPGINSGTRINIAGEKIPSDGFKICADCGVVDKPPSIQKNDKPLQNKKQVKHRYHCLSNTPSQKPSGKMSSQF